jgi:hypothetical protein
MSFRKLFFALLILNFTQKIDTFSLNFIDREYSENIFYGLFNVPDCAGHCNCGLGIVYANQTLPDGFFIDLSPFSDDLAIRCYVMENSLSFRPLLESIQRSTDRYYKFLTSHDQQPDNLDNQSDFSYMSRISSQQDMIQILENRFLTVHDIEKQLMSYKDRKVIIGEFLLSRDHTSECFSKDYLEKKFKNLSLSEIQEFLKDDSQAL